MTGDQLSTSAEHEPWAYRPQAWDSQELHQRLNGDTMAEVAGDDISVRTLCHVPGEELQRRDINIHFTVDTVQIGEDLVNRSHIRYVTTKTGHLATADNVILLSYRLVSAQDVRSKTKYCYIHSPDPEMAGKILNKFRYFQFSHIRHLLDDKFAQRKIDMLEFYVPKLICHAKVKVTNNRPPGEETEKRYIVTIDQECFCLFPHPYASEPDHQVDFWKDSSPHVVDKVAVTHATQQLVMETELFKYSMDAETPEMRDFIMKMRSIKPKPKDTFLDPVAMVKYLDEVVPQHVASAPVAVSGRRSGFSPPSQRTNGEQEIQYTRDTDTAMTESAKLWFRDFKEDLEVAYRQGNSNSDWQCLWQPNDMEIQQLLEVNMIPRKDARSGGLDPNSVEHFQRSIEDIVDKLFIPDFEGAISSLRSVREIFAESHFQEMRPILEDDDYMLLKKIFYKSLKESTL